MAKKKEPTRKVLPSTEPTTMTLRDIRTRVFGLSIVEMAKRIGTTRSTYWFWESEKRPMPDVFKAKMEALLATRSKEEPSGTATGGSEPSPDVTH